MWTSTRTRAGAGARGGFSTSVNEVGSAASAREMTSANASD